MTILDEAEYARLEKVVEAIEKMIGAKAESVGSASMLAEFAATARRRMESLEIGGLVDSAEKDRKKADQFQNVAVMYLVQRETRLSAAEREQYGSFLEKRFFTRSDFDELDGFYGSAWDRLTDDGKAQMSHRVWEGVRRGEYEFIDLPENVRKKEMEQLYGLMSDPERMPENLKQIPADDRKEFMAAVAAGREEEAAQILNRDTFRENVSVDPFVRHSEREEQTREEEKQEQVSKTETRDGEEAVVPPFAIASGKSSELSNLR